MHLKKFYIIAATRGINCTTVGENYFLQGGKPGRQAVCCEKKGNDTKFDLYTNDE